MHLAPPAIPHPEGAASPGVEGGESESVLHTGAQALLCVTCTCDPGKGMNLSEPHFPLYLAT